jgi:hypothetical protein
MSLDADNFEKLKSGPEMAQTKNLELPNIP